MKALLLLVLLFSLQLHAQSPVTTDSSAFTPGTWIVQQFNKQVIKVTFRPDDYLRNENISDAVIQKPDFESQLKKVVSSSDESQIKLYHASAIIHGSGIILKNNNTVLPIAYQADSGFRGFDIRLAPGEKIFGGGERALPLDRRGYRFKLYNGPNYGYGEGAENLNYSVPFVTSSRMYALFFDNVSRGYMDVGKTERGTFRYSAFSGDLTFYFITGESYSDILSAYFKLTGTQPLPPRWTLGTFMSRFGYTSQEQVTSIYNRMRENNVPFDAVIFDLFWFGDGIFNTLGNLDWVNRSRWPDPAKMIADFNRDGVKTILITEPFVIENTLTYDSFRPYFAVDSAGNPFVLKNFYFGHASLIDIFRSDARIHFWEYYKKQMDIGVAGWWGDLGEPETHPANLYHHLDDFGYKRLFSADEVHNIYGHYWTKMLFDKYALDYPNRRLFSLNRSGFAGSQRYGIFPWSGDVGRNWSGLRAQLPVMLGMSMSGVPYVHADAGGFAMGEKDPELYVRWLQFAQFTPLFRPHGTALYEIDTQAISYPSEIALMDSPYLQLARNAAVNRYRMLPYNYTLSYLQTTEAQPLVSPLYYYFSNDTAAYRAGDEFMWGTAILVAPVLEKNATSRNIFLPKGNWYHYNKDSLMSGGGWHAEKVSLNGIPVFVKAGSLIPLLPENKNIRNTTEYSTSEISWHYYASDTAATAILFDDDGESKNSLSEKKYETITASVSFKKGKRTFVFKSNGGNFPGKPVQRTFHLVLHGMKVPLQISPHGVSETATTSSSTSPEISFPFTGKKVVIKVK